MPRTRRETSLAILLLLVPVMFALIRAVQTGTDFRAVWMLVASLAAAALINAVWPKVPGRSNALFGFVVFIACTLLSAGVATLLGARAAFGVWAVAIAFGFCVGTAAALFKGANTPTV